MLAPIYLASVPPPWETHSPTIAGYRDWLLALLDALAVDRCVLADLSLGGAVALKVALAAPHRIAGLGLLAPYGLSPRTPGGRLGWASVHLPGVTTASYSVLPRSRSAMRHSLAMLLRRPGALTDPVIDEVTALLHLPDAGRAWRQLQRKEARWSGPATDLRTALGSVTCPAVLVSAEHDLVPPGDIRSAAKAMPPRPIRPRSGCRALAARDAPTDAAELINLRHRAASADTRGLSGRPLRPAELAVSHGQLSRPNPSTHSRKRTDQWHTPA